MTRRELAAVLVLLATVLILAALWPSPTKSDVPVVATAVPASEFVAIRSAGPIDRDNPHPALPQPRTPSPTLPTALHPDPNTVSDLGAVAPANEAPTGQPQGGAPTPAADRLLDATPLPASSPADGGVAISGVASWFASPIGVSAAGPALRTALGSGWRGRQVSVCLGQRCVSTILGDWCACPRRAIDLDAPIFAALAPLSQGLMEVTISW